MAKRTSISITMRCSRDLGAGGEKYRSPERYRAIYSNQPSTKTIEFLFAFKHPKK